MNEDIFFKGLEPEDVLVRAVTTPNPMAIKFVTNYPFKVEGKATFKNRDEAEGLTLVESIFDVLGVKQVHLFQNAMTITRTDELGEEMFVASIESIIRTRLPIHNPHFDFSDQPDKKVEQDKSHFTEKMKEIDEILDRTIRPGLQADGGDLDLISLEENELKILYQGACGGCPSAMMGTLDAIQSILQNELDNPDLKVRPI